MPSEDTTSTVPNGYIRQRHGMTNPYRIEGDVTRILIRRRNGERHEVLIDTEDLQRVLDIAHPLHVRAVKGKSTTTYYVNTTLEGNKVALHRYILNAMPGEEIDHHNHDGRDNRKRNLRIVDHATNAANRRMWAWQARKLVLQHKSGNHWGAWVFLGEFDTEESATRVFEEAFRALIAQDVWEYIRRELIASQERSTKEERSEYAA